MMDTHIYVYAYAESDEKRKKQQTINTTIIEICLAP